MKTIVRNILTFIGTIIVVAFIFMLFSEGFSSVARVPFSSLVDEIDKGKVKKLEVQDNDIKVTLADGKSQKSTKESEDSLVHSLTLYGISPDKIKKLEIETSTSGSVSFWLTTLIGTLLPLVLIGGFMWYLIRATGKRQMDAFGFIRSGAEPIALESKTKLTFKDVANLKEATELYLEEFPLPGLGRPWLTTFEVAHA